MKFVKKNKNKIKQELMNQEDDIKQIIKVIKPF